MNDFTNCLQMNKEELWEYQKKILSQCVNVKDVVITPYGVYHISEDSPHVVKENS